MPGRIFLTGASGFVGAAVLDELLARGYLVNALVHQKTLDPAQGRVESIQGGLFDPQAIQRGLRDCSAVVHLVGIIEEHPRHGVTFHRIHCEGARNVVDAATHAGVKRFVHMSALGTRPNAVSNYHKTKQQAEQLLRNSALDWTIIRPSLIHGPAGQFMQTVARWARKQAPPPFFFMPFMPYFGGRHAGRIQPVFVKDVARAFVDALEKPTTIGRAYELAGPDQMTWPQFHHICAQAIVHKRRLTAAMPLSVAKLLAALGIAPFLGFNLDQVLMSQEDNTCDLTGFQKDFGWQPRGFETSLRSYSAQL